MSTSESPTISDSADLRRWLRSAFSPTTVHQRPAWLGAVVDASHVRSVCAEVLTTCIEEGHLTAGQASAWAAVAGVHGQPAGQVELAERLGVSKRSVRKWIRTADDVMADKLRALAATSGPGLATARHQGSGDLGDIEVAVGVAALINALHAEHAPVEHIEAVRAFASDRLGGPRPRRSGARRWARSRFYETVDARIATSASPSTDSAIAVDAVDGGLLTMPYRLFDEPVLAIEELTRAWNNRDRTFVPLLANHALAAIRANPGLPVTHELHALEVIANALRDAENLQAFTVGARWKALAQRSFGPRDHRVWKAHGLLIHMMQIHGYREPARRAQLQHIRGFDHVVFPDARDRAIHELDRFARLITMEVRSPYGSRDRTIEMLAHMRRSHDRLPAVSAENEFALLRRRIEVQLVAAKVDARGQAVTGRPGLDPLISLLENRVQGLEAHRVLAAYELLIEIDAARRDWHTLERRLGDVERAVGDPAAPANLAERIDLRLNGLAARGLIEKPALVIPLDPLRQTRFGPPTARGTQ